MNIPGFTAEASLYRLGLSYQSAGDFSHMDGILIPQACDPVCLDNCGDPSDCDPDLPPRQRAACLAELRACVRRCCPTPPPPVCDPCPPPTCNSDCSQNPRTRTCHRSDGTTFTQSC